MKRTDVALGEYFVSEDGIKLTFHAGVMSSMGYIRGFKDNGSGVKPHYLTFYSTFAGLNSTFVFLSNIEEIAFDQAWKASGFSSNMDDYFDVDDAKFVAMK